jgi:hypothetical protein
VMVHLVTTQSSVNKNSRMEPHTTTN